jgi:hypothetical protein
VLVGGAQLALGQCADLKQSPRRLTAGAAHKPEVISWAVAIAEDAASSKQRRQLRSTPLFALPIFLTAPRQFSIADGAAIQFHLRLSSCRPGMGIFSECAHFTLCFLHRLLLDDLPVLWPCSLMEVRAQ